MNSGYANQHFHKEKEGGSGRRRRRKKRGERRQRRREGGGEEEELSDLNEGCQRSFHSGDLLFQNDIIK